MRVLVVGAGAVGQVYGRHLAQGGAEVSFYVRAKRAEEARAGYVLHRVRGRWRREQTRVVPKAVLCEPEEVRAAGFDQVWLCVPTDALDALEPLLEALGEATLVSLVPGLDVTERLRRHVSEARLVVGEIGMISYESPLEGSDAAYETATPPGTAYYLPPMGSRFGGAPAPARAIVACLRRGGCPARVSAHADLDLLFSSALLLPIVAALELDGWSFAALRGGRLSIGSAAGKEALAIVSRRSGERVPLALRLVSRPILWLALWLAPRLAPLDLEAFFRVHFRKVGEQTRVVLASYLSEGRAASLPTAALSELHRSLPAGA